MKPGILFTFLLLLPFSIRAQVTIGSNIPPIKGAILQIMEQQPDEANVTATSGGLLLPRVGLLSKTSLIPLMGDTVGQNKIHAGLMVYNVKAAGGLEIGTYVWNGTEWRKMSCNTPANNKILFIESRNVQIRGYGTYTSAGTFDDSELFENISENPLVSYSFVIPAGLLKQDYGYIDFSLRVFRSQGLGLWHVGLKMAIDGIWKNSYFYRWDLSGGDFVRNGRIFYNDGRLVIETAHAEYSRAFDYDITKDITIAIYAGTDDPSTRETVDYARFEWHP